MNIKSYPKSFYDVRSKSKTKTKVGPLIDFQNMQVEEEEQMCEIINQYFSSVFTLETPKGWMNEFYNLYSARETRGSSPGMYSPAVINPLGNDSPVRM